MLAVDILNAMKMNVDDCSGNVDCEKMMEWDELLSLMASYSNNMLKWHIADAAGWTPIKVDLMAKATADYNAALALATSIDTP